MEILTGSGSSGLKKIGLVPPLYLFPKAYVKRHLLVCWWTSLQSTSSTGKSNLKSASHLKHPTYGGWEIQQIAVDMGLGLMEENLELYVDS